MTEAAVTFTGDFSLKVFAMMKGIKKGGLTVSSGDDGNGGHPISPVRGLIIKAPWFPPFFFSLLARLPASLLYSLSFFFVGARRMAVVVAAISSGALENLLLILQG